MTRNDWKGVAIGVVAAVALAAALYFTGRWQERNLAVGEHAELATQVEAAQAELAQAQARVAAAEDRSRLLRARSLLFETALDLERRNFGTANQRLEAAAEELTAVGSDGGGLDPAQLEALRRRVEETDLNVATNLQTQRDQVLQLITRLDELMSAEGGVAR